MNWKKKNRMSLILVILAIALVGGALIYFLNRDKQDAAEPVTERLDIPFRKQGSLAFLSAAGNDTISVIDIEVADNNQRRARGLMYRNSLPAEAGMLFIFDVEEIQGFWMKNTYIPLDMLFVNASKEIVTIHANTTPMREWNYASTQPALYVVEVNAGYCAQNNISEGDKIVFER
ncbi:MAG: DUF192 domain-containing protein [Bacteroidia bacterium]|nr:DUF192 domain-containing protein [Bacteroidia bacterium]